MILTEAQYKILQPVVHTCRIFGLCPISFKKIGSQYQMKYSPILVLYSCTFVIIFGIGTILGVRQDNHAGRNGVRMKSSTKYITLCDIAMVFIIATYSIILIHYRMKRFIRMIFIWNLIDKVIPIAEYQKYRKYSIIFIIGTLATATCLFSLDILMYDLRGYGLNGPAFFLQNYFSYYVLYFTLVLQNTLFWHLVFFIHIRIVSLNEQLLNEKKTLLSSSKKVFFIPYPFTYTVKNKGNLVEEKVKNYEKGIGTVKFGKSTGERIQELINIFGKVKESVEVLNDSASYGIVLLVLSCLLHLVVTPYFLLIELYKKNPSFEVIAVQALWFVGHVGSLLTLVEPCHRCLRDVAGAVTTYLVILFQFNGKNES